jgi:hypothetical protein
MQILLGKHWHYFSHAHSLEFLGTDPDCGLDLFKIQHRRERLGKNRFQEKKAPFSNSLNHLIIP